jgi:hypothetical protein
MPSSLLLPNRYKKFGWILLLPSVLMGIIIIFSDFDNYRIMANVFAIISDERDSLFGGNFAFFGIIQANIANTIIGILFIAGALLVSFSREENEDEFIANLRQTSLLWAVLVNYILLLFAFLFIYGVFFLNVMLYNMFTILIIFIGRFNYLLYRNNQSLADEK